MSIFPITLPPIHDEYCLSLLATTSIGVFTGANSSNSFFILPWKLSNNVFPPARTTLLNISFLISEFDFKIDLKTISCKPSRSNPILFGSNIASGIEYLSVLNLTIESSGKGCTLNSPSLGLNFESGFNTHSFSFISEINSNSKGVVNSYPFSNNILF